MKLSKEYIISRLQDTPVETLAREIAEDAAKSYPSHLVKMDESIEKFKAILRPFAPVKEVKATDLMASMGINVTEVR